MAPKTPTSRTPGTPGPEFAPAYGPPPSGVTPPMAPTEPAVKRGGWILPVIIALVVVLLGGGLGYWMYSQDHNVRRGAEQAQSALDDTTFVSFAQRWTGVGLLEWEPSHGSPDIWLVGFTRSGREVDIYQFTSPYQRYLVSGNHLFIMECGDNSARLLSIDYTAATGTYPPEARAELGVCPDEFTVIDAVLYYTKETSSEELAVRDLDTDVDSDPIVFDLSEARQDDGEGPVFPGVSRVVSTDTTLFYSLNDSVMRTYDTDTGDSRIACENCWPEVVSETSALFLSYPENTISGENAEFLKYDPRSGQTQSIADLTYYSTGMSSRPLSPVGQGYVYLTRASGTMGDATYQVIYTELGQTPRVLHTLDDGDYDVIFPNSGTTLLVEGSTPPVEGSVSQTLLVTITLDGEPVNSTQGEVDYTNIQFPRFSA